MKVVTFVYEFLGYLARNPVLILSLIKNDFRRQFLGSYFGVAWAFIQPLVMVMVLWIVFEFGFRAKPQDSDVPFALWLMSGMFPWFYFATSMNAGLQAVTSNAFLVKKIAFNVDILPLVKITSALIVHVILLLILGLLYVAHGVGPSLYWLQVPYYTLCLYLLVLGISTLTSSVYVFIRDIGNIVAITLQVGFWLTPVFWSYERVPEKYHWILQLNPVFYVVKGYRDSLIGRNWFWENGVHSGIFYLQLLVLLYVGFRVFRRLKVHFGDVL